MLSSLDPHSTYMNPKAYSDMRAGVRGKFGGLGIEVTMEGGYVKVVSPIDDTPAYRAGIQSGDLITHLDGEQVLGLTLNDAVERMRGAIGTTIVLTVLREGVQPFDVSITRDEIRIKSIRFEVMEDVGYIRITTFSEQTETGLNRASGVNQTDGTHGIVFPVSSAGGRAPAKPAHRQARPTHRGDGKHDPSGGLASPPAALRGACDAPASRRAPRLAG